MLRNGADQERHEFVGGGSPDRCDSAARKEALGRVLRYRIFTHPQNARAAGNLAVSRLVQLILDEHRREDVGSNRTNDSDKFSRKILPAAGKIGIVYIFWTYFSDQTGTF